MKTTIKKLKPIDADIHLKYRCPNPDCHIDHWLSLLETQTKNFKVVCDCGTIFLPKRISKIKTIYSKKPKQVPSVESSIESTKEKTIEKTNTIDRAILDSSSAVLCVYGFTKKEAIDLILEAYDKNPTEDSGELVKLALKIFGDKNGK